METSPSLLTTALRDGALYIDNSMMELLTTCPRALEYNRILRKIKAENKPSLSFGSAIHLALEHRYKNYANLSPDPLLLQEQATLLTEYFQAHPSQEGDYRTLNWAMEIIRRYNDRYNIEPFQLLDDPKTGNVFVELAFAIPLCVINGIQVIYTGRIDLPVMWDGLLTIIDHKTTSMLGVSFSDGMKMSAQQKGYCWAFQELTGQEVKSYCINALRVKEPPIYLTDPNSTRKGKSTPAQWWDESFVRERYYLREDELVEWKFNAIAIVKELFYHFEQNYLPMKTAWCNKFGRCQYFDVCTLPKADRNILLDSGCYADNLWDPLKEPTQPLA